jgi:L-histidine N-alpha-methyltransferase
MTRPTEAVIEPVIDVHLGLGDLDRALRADIHDGLTTQPKELQPKWFYDERGSDLFDQITRLAEYYPTEAEREILFTHADTIIERAGADTIVELGAGTSDKTRALLDAARVDGRLDRFIPFDVSEEFLRSTAATFAQTYPGLRVHGVVGDFDRHLERIPGGGRRLVVLLGGTIGNYQPVPRKEFLRRIVEGMRPGDRFLLGTDLVKEQSRLELAYDDPAGITAEFNKNILQVVNRELDADFDLDRFDHVATWDDHEEWMDLGLRSRVDHDVRVEALDLDVHFAAGEYMRTEVSAKFRIENFTAELASVGLHVEHWFTDRAADFAVSLSVLR